MPWERHDHYDTDDNPTGYTIVTRGSEWSDEQRNRMLALAEYERQVHETCGLHDSIAREDPHFTLEDRVCPVCAAVESHMRGRAIAEHKVEEKRDAADRRPSDGRTIGIRLLSPVEVAAMKAAADAPAQR